MSASTFRQSSKRKRTGEEPTTAVVTRSRLWFDDGNVVLIAKDDVVGFRLHRGLLSHHSRIFKDILSPPSRDEDSEMLEGCPVMHLQDCSKDLELFFGLFYDGETQRYLYDPVEWIEFSYLRSLIILSSKYEVKHIRKAAVARLEVDFPTDLHSYDAKFYNDCAIGAQFEDDTTECIALVNMARKFDLGHFLPIALYTCANSEIPSQLWDPVEYGASGKEQLLTEDLRRCLCAIPEFDIALTSRINIFLDFRSDLECNGPTGDCTQLVCSIFMRLNDCYPEFITKFWTFRPIDKEIEGLLSCKPQDEHPCGPCLKRLLRNYDGFRRSLWEKLPDIFNLK